MVVELLKKYLKKNGDEIVVHDLSNKKLMYSLTKGVGIDESTSHQEDGNVFKNFDKSEAMYINSLNLLGDLIEKITGYEDGINSLENDKTFIVATVKGDNRVFVECCDSPESEFWKKLASISSVVNYSEGAKKIETEYSNKIDKDIYGYPIILTK